MAQIKKRVFGENVSERVLEEFKKLSGGGLDGTSLQPLETRNPTFQKYLGEKTPFSRMWCAVNINKYSEAPPANSSVEKNSKGEYFYYINPKDKKNGGVKIIGNDKNSEIKVFTVNENNENSYADKNNPLDSIQTSGVKSLQQVKQLNNNPLMKPAAGITSVISKTQGALGALQNTTVEFIVHNKHDFENIFLPFFLKPGSIVCVDYGWSDIPVSLYNPIDQIKDKSLDMSEFDEYLYGAGGFLLQNYGKVNTVMGNVVSYEANVNTEGSYNCSIEIVSRNTNLLDKRVNDDNELKFIFSNVIHDVLVNVLAVSKGADVIDTLEELTDNISSVDPIDTKKLAKAFLSQTSDTVGFGVISPYASSVGIFHQKMVYTSRIPKANRLDEQDEVTYISYGLFEDLFLNNLVVGTVPVDDVNKDRKPFSKDPTKDYSNKFDSRLSYIRWDEELFRLQKDEPTSGEGLYSFIIPDSWDNSYNRINSKASEPDKAYGEWLSNTKDDKTGKNPKYLGNNVMPMRDLFISVPLIENAFKTKDTVNDALLFILEQLNMDSHKVWNLKLSANVDSKSNISVIDTNLLPEIKEEKEMLIFDVTGETSIVSNCELKFTTPKAGLSSMIAIGNLDGPQRFDELELSALNHLNLLNKPKGKDDEPTVVKSLPLQGVTNKSYYGVASLDFTTFVRPQKTKPKEFIGPRFTPESQDDKIINRYRLYKEQILAEPEEESEDEGVVGAVAVDMSGYHIVNSDREYRKALLRKQHYEKSAENRVSPILPIELDLSVYGNKYLQIGDYFNINYLPNHYKERVFFQIIGTEDKIDVNGWQTSYTSVMRVRPNKKEIVTGRVDVKDIFVDSRLSPLSNAIMDGVLDENPAKTLIDSFTKGYKPLDFNISNPNLEIKCYEHLIAPVETWTEKGRIRNVARTLRTVGQTLNGIEDLDGFAFNCAVRDMFFAGSGDEHRFFKKEFSIKTKYPSSVIGDIENGRTDFFAGEIFEEYQDDVIDKNNTIFGKDFELSIIESARQAINSSKDQYVSAMKYFFQQSKELPQFYSNYFCRIPELSEFQKIIRIESNIGGNVDIPTVYIPQEFLKVSVDEIARFLFDTFNLYYESFLNPRTEQFKENIQKQKDKSRFEQEQYQMGLRKVKTNWSLDDL